MFHEIKLQIKTTFFYEKDHHPRSLGIDGSVVIRAELLHRPRQYHSSGITTVNESTQQISYYGGAVHFSEAVTAPASIRLYDMSVREVLSQDGFTATVMPINNTFAQGVYIIHLQNSNYSISRKLPILQ